VRDLNSRPRVYKAVVEHARRTDRKRHRQQARRIFKTDLKGGKCPPPCIFQVAVPGAHFSLVDECLYFVFSPKNFCTVGSVFPKISWSVGGERGV
jgi:hypothetical protein